MADSHDVNTEQIASAGDVVLVVGTQTEVKLLISSTVLSSASKVFAALLGPAFREGQGLASASQPKQTTLREDEPQAMSDMCNFLHGRAVVGFLEVAPSARILSIAIAADKYACVDAQRSYSRAILSAHLRVFNHESMLVSGELMLAAYLLDSSEAFSEATSRLISGTTSEYSELLNQRLGLPYSRECTLQLGV
ncbi:hypothetical protein LTR37_018066 [Vermiconidia calcicola]|uniref:Uncharacterized protein n=1 Tax=Vermiconidia calcicola TaxID=1690605 RepID=A0ACC3MI78_9PEZI|nr:hypothetical protein LTR37_018066 [Vermiconidia calcicola]